MIHRGIATQIKYDDAYWEEEYKRTQAVLKGHKEGANINTILYWLLSILIIYLLILK